MFLSQYFFQVLDILWGVSVLMSVNIKLSVNQNSYASDFGGWRPTAVRLCIVKHSNFSYFDKELQWYTLVCQPTFIVFIGLPHAVASRLTTALLGGWALLRPCSLNNYCVPLSLTYDWPSLSLRPGPRTETSRWSAARRWTSTSSTGSSPRTEDGKRWACLRAIFYRIYCSLKIIKVSLIFNNFWYTYCLMPTVIHIIVLTCTGRVAVAEWWNCHKKSIVTTSHSFPDVKHTDDCLQFATIYSWSQWSIV